MSVDSQTSPGPDGPWTIWEDESIMIESKIITKMRDIITMGFMRPGRIKVGENPSIALALGGLLAPLLAS
jgi:hypothetical protein